MRVHFSHLLFYLGIALALLSSSAVAQNKAHVFVSVIPLKYFADQLVQERINVSSFVESGHTPHHYDPSLIQMKAVANTKLFFRMGVPLEEAWMGKLKLLNPDLSVVDLRKSIEMKAKGLPHLWTSPVAALTLVEEMATHLKEKFPEHIETITQNELKLLKQLKELHQEIKELLSPYTGRSFLVYHPAWDAYAETYGLKQVAIENEGKEPGPRDLAEVTKWGKENGIKTLFVQEQFMGQLPQAVAKSLHAEVVNLNPLAYDYISNMRFITQQFVKSFKQ